MAVKPASRSTRMLFDQWISENVGKEENIPFQDLTEDAISQIQ